ncbi:MAG: SRPBCC family protein [Ilumatobacteraceae bacterium]
MIVRDGVTIDAPIERVWDVYSDVERWPEWTASVTSLTLIEGTEVALGTRARIKQPRFPNLVWEVTEVEPGVSWTWVSRSPGARTVATHLLRSTGPSSTTVEQVIEQTGVLGSLVGRLTRRLTRRYLAMEAAGLEQRVEADVSTT